MKTVIGIVGQQASGKGTIAAYLEKAHGARKFRFSDALFDMLERLAVEPTRDNLITLSEIVRGAFGETVLARALAAEVERADASLVVIDGVRREGDIETFQTLSGFHLVAVAARPEIRYERAKKRGEKPEESSLSYEDFLALEKRSTEVSAKALEGKAEIAFDNNGSIEDLYRQVDEFLKNVGEKK
jgi:dephospho-CoA kinase